MLTSHLCNYRSGPYAEQFFETVLHLEQWFKRKCCLRHKGGKGGGGGGGGAACKIFATMLHS